MKPVEPSMADRKLSTRAREMLMSCVERAHPALEAKDLQVAQDVFDDFVRRIEDFHHLPNTQGSLADRWLTTHWHGTNRPIGDQIFTSLRAVATAIELWVEREPHVFDEPEHWESGTILDYCPFYSRSLPVDPSLVFMLMPFTEGWSSRIWRRHIKPAVQRVPVDPPLVAQRADDLFG